MENLEMYRKAYEFLLYARSLCHEAGMDSITLQSLDYVMREVAKRTVNDGQ